MRRKLVGHFDLALTLATVFAVAGCARAKPVGACGSDPSTGGPCAAGSTTTRVGDGAPSARAPRESGCGRPAPQSGDFHLRAIDGAGASRDYEVLVPPRYDPATPLALTFVFHGAGGTEATAKALGLQRVEDARASTLFVFPQGAPFERQGVGWNDTCAGYDIVFFDRMLQRLESDFCVDPARVFAAGFSWGCDQVTALMCCRGSRIRAVAAASCSDDFRDPADFRTYVNFPCPEAGSTAIRFTHDANGDSGYTAREFETTRALYRALDRCSTDSTPTPPAPCESFVGCAQPFIECAYPGLGHSVPPTWAADTWSFFSTLSGGRGG